MVDRIINTKNIKNADTVLLSVPYENSLSFMGGTEKAPKKIMHCLDNNLELFDIDLLCEPVKKKKTANKEVPHLKKLAAEKALRKISSEYGKLFNKGKFVIMLGGEHTISFAALKAISRIENPKEVTILQIDAHQDLRDDNGDYSQNRQKFAHS